MRQICELSVEVTLPESATAEQSRHLAQRFHEVGRYAVEETDGFSAQDVRVSVTSRGDFEQAIGELANAVAEQGITNERQEELDEMVHDAASKAAAIVNNQGLEGQVRFLIEELGLQQARAALTPGENLDDKTDETRSGGGLRAGVEPTGAGERLRADGCVGPGGADGLPQEGQADGQDQVPSFAEVLLRLQVEQGVTVCCWNHTLCMMLTDKADMDVPALMGEVKFLGFLILLTRGSISSKQYVANFPCWPIGEPEDCLCIMD